MVGGENTVTAEAIGAMENYFYSMFGNETLTNTAEDLQNTWKLLLGSVGFSFVLGFFFLLLIRFFGGALIYLFIILSELLFLAGGFYAWFYLKNDYTTDSTYYQGLYYGAIFSWTIAGLVALCVCCCWNTIKLGIAVFKATAQFIGATPSIFTLPVTFTILAASWVMFWLVSFVFLYSIGEPSPNP